MTKAEIDNYLNEGFELFRVIEIDTIRDGGTKVVKTTKGYFTVGYLDYKIHNKYGEEMTSDIFKKYLVNRITAFAEVQKSQSEESLKLASKIL